MSVDRTFDAALRCWLDARTYPGRRRERADRGLSVEERWAKRVPDLPPEAYAATDARCAAVVRRARDLALAHERGEVTELEAKSRLGAEHPDLSRERVVQAADYGWSLAIK